jgi:hypothetical protein
VRLHGGFQLDVLTGVLVLPPGRPLTDGELTDGPNGSGVERSGSGAGRCLDELPPRAIVVERWGRDRTGTKLANLPAFMYVEQPQPESIVIGARCPAEGGRHRGQATIRRCWAPGCISTCGQGGKDWQRDPKQLRRLGLRLSLASGRPVRGPSQLPGELPLEGSSPQVLIAAVMCGLSRQSSQSGELQLVRGEQLQHEPP